MCKELTKPRSLGLGSKLIKNKVCLYSLLTLSSQSWEIRMPPSLLVQGGYCHLGDLSPAFWGTEGGQSIPLTPAVSQVTLIRNNQYAKGRI